VKLSAESLQEVFEIFFELHDAESPGVSVQDWVAAILQIKDNKQRTPFSN